MRDDILILATQGWQKLLDENDNLNAIDRLVEHFSIPLVKANVCLETIYSEFEGILDYACQYISLSTLEYRAEFFMHLFHLNGLMHLLSLSFSFLCHHQMES